MPNSARHALCPLLVAVALALGGCGSAGAGNVQAQPDSALDETNAMATGPSVDNPSMPPPRNILAGEVLPGQEVMFTGEGLGVAAIGNHLAEHFEFGRPKWEIVTMARHLRGAPTGAGTLTDCREGPIDYVDFGNLRVNFQQDRFVGWDAAPGDPPVRDEWNFHIGKSRRDITENDQDVVRVRRTGRGWEFESGGLRGLLASGGPDALVTDLWAGAVCTPR